MTITLTQIIALLPILIIGVMVIIIMLSIAYHRNALTHVILTIIGLILAILAIAMIWPDQKSQDIFYLIHIDSFIMFYSILVLLSSIISSIVSYTWLLNYPGNCDEFYLLLLISSMGGIFLISANHLVLLFLGIELITLPLFGLISYSYIHKFALEASMKYIILSGVSSAFLLFGIALIYAETGCLSFFGISQVLLSVYNTINLVNQPMVLLSIGLGMMLIGFFIKLSCVPFHLWTPDVYQGAPASVSMYLTTGMKIAIISVLVRFLMIFPNQFDRFFYIFLSGVSCCSILFGNLMAVLQDNIKRILAYSSIAHMGYLLIGLIALRTNDLAMESIGIYLISYLLANIGAFSVISLISSACANKDADLLCLYRGLFWYQPKLSVAFTIIILSFAGVPLTLGFISKFYLLVLGVNSQLWWLSILMIIGSIISMFYCLKIIINLYIAPKYQLSMYLNAISLINCTGSLSGILVISIACILLFLGLYPQPVIYIIQLINKV